MKDSYKKHLIECDGYAYFMAGSSPCEDCEDYKNDSVISIIKCQEQCKDYQDYMEVYRNYFDNYIKKKGYTED